MDGENNGKAYFQMDDLGTHIFGNIHITHIWVLSKHVDDTMLCGNDMCSLSNMFVVCLFWRKKVS